MKIIRAISSKKSGVMKAAFLRVFSSARKLARILAIGYKGPFLFFWHSVLSG
ncbi:hypothetical protein AB205_0033080 [Aquarana catesbeiana]|uniref:Uncharacterized protein n=1 Tax=Aquarana catesbeiana TaxID=8400 RepID=A0A2G9S560_AQUCT|nr:hypothetical protein AB205_0033080 [Aquarana catesbeiana]